LAFFKYRCLDCICICGAPCTQLEQHLDILSEDECKHDLFVDQLPVASRPKNLLAICLLILPKAALTWSKSVFKIVISPLKKNNNAKTYFNNCCKRLLTAFGRLQAITSTAICCNGIIVKFTESLFVFSWLCLKWIIDAARRFSSFLLSVICVSKSAISLHGCDGLKKRKWKSISIELNPVISLNEK
ncbi:hypothetical protein T4B_7743, partial [Trichinella pseudospiralis]